MTSHMIFCVYLIKVVIFDGRALKMKCIQSRVIYSSEKLVEDMEVSVSFGLENYPRFFKEVIDDVPTNGTSL